MDLGLRDRVAIVGGSTRGIGLAVAIALAREGASVAICGRDEAALRRAEIELARISNQHRVLAIPADLSHDRDIRRVVRDTYNRFDRVGILVTHMGHPETGPATEFTDEAITAALERNLYSAIRLSREVIPHMKQQHWGRIINLLSSSSQEVVDGTALSSLSQLAIMGFFRALASELAPFNITVNNMVSGPVETELFRSRMEERAQAEGQSASALMQKAVKQIPLGRLGRPEEVGDVLAFLASERSSFVTGTTLIADGGILPGIP
jgi:3-oxoacyl-[acyl-carrier protein] reductase